MSENKSLQPLKEKPGRANENKAEGKKSISSIVSVVLVVQVILAVIAGIWLFKRGYEQSKSGTEAKIRQDAYDTVYGASERANHVSNNVSISLDAIREKAELEVLQVDSTYLYLTDRKEQASGLTIWYRIPGSGTYTVDMRMAEFVVDNERHHVLVKVPSPSITQFRENYERTEKLFYKNDRIFDNGSVQEGEHIARKMLAQAHVTMARNLEMNPAYYQAAKDASARIITQLIRSMNPDVSQISVDVVFVE